MIRCVVWDVGKSRWNFAVPVDGRSLLGERGCWLIELREKSGELYNAREEENSLAVIQSLIDNGKCLIPYDRIQSTATEMEYGS